MVALAGHSVNDYHARMLPARQARRHPRRECFQSELARWVPFLSVLSLLTAFVALCLFILSLRIGMSPQALRDFRPSGIPVIPFHERGSIRDPITILCTPTGIVVNVGQPDVTKDALLHFDNPVHQLPQVLEREYDNRVGSDRRTVVVLVQPKSRWYFRAVLRISRDFGPIYADVVDADYQLPGPSSKLR